jgi:hypothetical protein
MNGNRRPPRSRPKRARTPTGGQPSGRPHHVSQRSQPAEDARQGGIGYRLRRKHRRNRRAQITAEAIVRDISIAVSSQEHEHQVVEAVRQIEGINVFSVSNPILLAHRGGKIEIASKKPIKTRADLSTYYTPGVAEPCLDPDEPKRRSLHNGETVAVVSNGTAVLGWATSGPKPRCR